MKWNRMFILAFVAFLWFMACTGGKGEASTDEALTDSVASSDSAISSVVSDTLVFETIHRKDSVKVKTYFEREDSTGLFEHSFDYYFSYAVGGRPEAVAFINDILLKKAAQGKEDNLAKVKGMKGNAMKNLLELQHQDYYEECAELFTKKYSKDDECSDSQNNMNVILNTPTLVTFDCGYYEHQQYAAMSFYDSYEITYDIKNLRQLNANEIFLPKNHKDILKILKSTNKDGESFPDGLKDLKSIRIGLRETNAEFSYFNFDFDRPEMYNRSISYQDLLPYLTPDVKELLGDLIKQ